MPAASHFSSWGRTSFSRKPATPFAQSWWVSSKPRRAGTAEPLHALGSLPTTLTKLTQAPGWPPRLWVSPSVRPAVMAAICRSAGASPRSWSQHSKSIRRPHAPMG